jgi:hypothetical protein
MTKNTFHVVRGSNGEVISVSHQPQLGSELIDASDAGVQNFLGRSDAESGSEPSFGSSDAEFVRVIEDVIDTLIKNGVMRFTDLPVAVQKKITTRRGMRSRRSGALDLLDDDKMIF